MFKVLHPSEMNEAFAIAFNSRDIERLLALYEDGASLRVQLTTDTSQGKAAIGVELGKLLGIPGTMVSTNRFCIEHGDIALLSAEWALRGPQGEAVATGITAEVVRRQKGGSWLYMIDHAAALGVSAT
jgi:ketosteroid isomerase-like protein